MHNRREKPPIFHSTYVGKCSTERHPQSKPEARDAHYGNRNQFIHSLHPKRHSNANSKEEKSKNKLKRIPDTLQFDLAGRGDLHLNPPKGSLLHHFSICKSIMHPRGGCSGAPRSSPPISLRFPGRCALVEPPLYSLPSEIAIMRTVHNDGRQCCRKGVRRVMDRVPDARLPGQRGRHRSSLHQSRETPVPCEPHG